MKSIFRTAKTPFGFCGFGYIDDNDLKQFLAESNSFDSEGLKICNISQTNLPAPQLSKQQTIEKVRTEIQNNQQLKTFLSKMPVNEQRQFIKNILDSILGLYQTE